MNVQENIILFSGNQITPQSLEKQIDKLQQEMSALVKIIAQGGDSEFYAAKLRQLSEQKMGLTSQTAGNPEKEDGRSGTGIPVPTSLALYQQ